MKSQVEIEQDAPGWEAPPAARSFLQVFWQRKAFVLLGAFVGLALGFLYHMQRPAVYQSSCQILVIRKRAEAMPLAAGTDPRTGVVEDYMATHLVLLRSPLILERAVKKRDLGSLKTFENVGDPVGAILGGLTVARDTKETAGAPNNILQLTYRGPVAEDCGKVLTAIVESYQEFLDITYRNVSDQTLELITKARDILKRDLSESEEKYLKFRQNSPLFWVNDKGASVEQMRVADFETNRSQLVLRKTELRERIDALEKAIKEGRGMDVLPAIQAGMTGPDGKPLANERYVEEPVLPLILEEQKLLEDFGEDHPQVKSVRKRIETVRTHLRKISPQPTETDPAKRALGVLQFELSETEVTLKSVSEMLDKMKAEARSLGNESIQEAHLRTEVARIQLVYDGTIKRLTEINLVRDSGGFDARPLSTAGIGGKIAPIAYQNLAGGLMLGLLLGAGLAYLADASDKSFRNPEEIRRRLGLPIVGHIPFLTADADTERKRAAGEVCVDPLLCTHLHTRSLEAEAYRAVRTALFFATQGVGHKVIQVTSPNKGDGKSLMIANVAIMVAQSGKRVLLIDADLRRPRLHKIFALQSEGGLAVVLAGGADAASATVPTCVPNLSLLPSGQIPQNPSELLTSPRFRDLLEAARAEYDYVLIDTPPLLAVTDPCVVAGRVDGLFLTIRLTRKGRPDAERAREILAGLGVKVFGVVVNGLSRAASGIYSPNAYDYTESYGEDEPDDDKYNYYEEEPAPAESIRSAQTTTEHAATEHAATPPNGKTGPVGTGASKRFWGWWRGNG